MERCLKLSLWLRRLRCLNSFPEPCLGRTNRALELILPKGHQVRDVEQALGAGLAEGVAALEQHRVAGDLDALAAEEYVIHLCCLLLINLG